MLLGWRFLRFAHVSRAMAREGKASGLRGRSRGGAQLTMRPFVRIALTLETPTGVTKS